MIEKYVNVGISVNMLFPQTLVDETAHLRAFQACCDMEKYDALDFFLPEDTDTRNVILGLLSEAEKIANYNAPPAYQEAKYDAGSRDKHIRISTMDLIKRHIEYAAQSGSSIFVIPSCRDTRPEDRVSRLEVFHDFLCETAEYAKTYGITMVLEPIERHRFKKMLLGPTGDCVRFIKALQADGNGNIQLMIDTAHIPLMEEDVGEALRQSMEVGLRHVHIGNAVLDENSVLYGHMHAPLSVPHGEYGFEDLSGQIVEFIAVGYIHAKGGENKPTISYEIRPYPGVSSLTSAQVAYEMLDNAFMAAISHNQRQEIGS